MQHKPHPEPAKIEVFALNVDQEVPVSSLKRPGPNPNQPPPDQVNPDLQSPSGKGPLIIKNVDATTLITVIVIALLVPLLITGFLSQ
ncbi:MAG: hypothetical protein ACFB0C_15055 [Leptolyngbyaceae cyanobacterium]